MTSSPLRVDIVIPTVGRRSLFALLDVIRPLARSESIGAIIVVDDRAHPGPALDVGDGVLVLRSGGRGPAAARNEGWRAGRAPWVVFVDDDVVIDGHWFSDLLRDLADADAEADVAGCQARLTVPLPDHRRPTDWERNVAHLQESPWITADMAYRRAALSTVGGFDERFPRAYREDSDIALRILRHGWRIVPGTRVVLHPVQPASPWISVRKQAGNEDDVLMRAIHGPDWRRLAGVGPGRLAVHAVCTAFAIVALLSWAGGLRGMALTAGSAWLALTAEFTWARIRPGPRTLDEVTRMISTSLVLPAVACGYSLRGWLRLSATLADETRAPRPEPPLSA